MQPQAQGERALPVGLVWGLAAAMAVLAANGALCALSVWRLAEIHRLADRSQAVLTAARDVLSALKDAETGQRGFLLTGKDEYLEPYRAGLSAVAGRVAALRELTADDPEASARHGRIAELVGVKLAELERTVGLRREKGLDAAVAVVATDEGRRAMDGLRSELAAISDAERVRLTQREAEGETAGFRALTAIALATVANLGLVAAVAWLVARELASRRRAAAEIRGQAERLRVTLASIGDAVVATDPAGRVEVVNPVAEGLTGWPSAEAAGRPLAEVFRVINEETREPIENPVETVLREGRIVGLANHTVLISRDGRERPIDDSAAPIRDAEGRLAGVVMVFRDLSARQADARERERMLTEERRRRAEVEALAKELADREGRLAEALRREETARAAAESANRLKDDFLSTLSHELRTPLNAIVGWVQMLRMGGLDEAEAKHGLEVIERNTRIQKQLINDLLDVSRIVSGKLHLEVQPTDPAAVVRAAMDSVLPAAQAKGIVIEAESAPGLPMMPADPHRLQQIVWNLLTNAVKFTPSGGRVTVRVERIAASDSDAAASPESAVGAAPAVGAALSRPRPAEAVRIVVSDTGQGIPPEFVPHVFERFRQLDSSTTRRHGGLGLGLGIVRHLTEAHGGTVSAASEGTGKGASFSVTLPARAVRMAPRPAQPAPAPAVPAIPPIPPAESDGRGAAAPSIGPAPQVPLGAPPASAGRSGEPATDALRGIRILVVDDEDDARQVIAFVLRKYGADVETAASASEALAALKDRSPDVLLSDIGMPGEDGYSLIGKLREMPADRGGRVPAAALTAFARVEDRERSLRAGFQAHLAKPVDPAELATLVGRLAGRPGDDGKAGDDGKRAASSSANLPAAFNR
jgi:PAS domain S-box-containing protein